MITSEGHVNYFVIGPDGSKFGPADLATLNRWATEGRVTAATILEEEGTGRRVGAPEVPGLNLGMSAAPDAPPTWNQAQGPMPGYYRTQGPNGANAGGTELILAWVFGSIGLLCCPIVFSTVGIVLANIAKQKGQPNGNAAMIFCIVTLAAGIAIGAVLASTGAFHPFRRF